MNALEGKGCQLSEKEERGGSGMGYVLVGSVAQVAHLHVEIERVVDVVEEGFTVFGDQGEVVESVESTEKSGFRKLSCLVVDKPASHVGIQSLRGLVEEFLHTSECGTVN